MSCRLSRGVQPNPDGSRTEDIVTKKNYHLPLFRTFCPRSLNFVQPNTQSKALLLALACILLPNFLTLVFEFSLHFLCIFFAFSWAFWLDVFGFCCVVVFCSDKRGKNKPLVLKPDIPFAIRKQKRTIAVGRGAPGGGRKHGTEG